MRVIHSLQRPFALAVLSMTLGTTSACSKLAYRARDILKPPVTWTVAYQQGRSEAKNDVANGRLRYRAYGMPTVKDGTDLYAQHLRNDYNIEIVTVAGCVVTEDLVNRTRGYNETALPIIEARYGKGILERLQQAAIEERNQTHKAE